MSNNPKGVIIMRNKIPDLLHARRLNITDFHTLLTHNPGTKISYPTAHKLATDETVPPKTEVQTLAKVATVLGVTFNDLIEIVIQ